jgi:hypothetical protein
VTAAPAKPALDVLEMVTGQLRRTAESRPDANIRVYLTDLVGYLTREVVRRGGPEAVTGPAPTAAELTEAGLLRLERSFASSGHVRAIASGLADLGFTLVPAENRNGRAPQNYLRIVPRGGRTGVGYLKPRTVTFIRAGDRAELAALPGAKPSRQQYGGVEFTHEHGPDQALAAAKIIAASLSQEGPQ